MAKLNFPDPSVTQIYTEAGITWTWNSSLNVWSSAIAEVERSSSVFVSSAPPAGAVEGDLWWNTSDNSGRLYVYYEDANSSQWVEASPQGDTLTKSDADGLYLSKVTNDTAAGAITFEEQTTHEGGVKVTGGTIQTSSIYDNVNSYGVRVNANLSSTTTPQNINLFDAYPSGASPSATNAVGFRASARLINAASTVYGFYSAISDEANHFSFYAGGNAPSFFQGVTEHEGGVKVTGGYETDIVNGIGSRNTSDQRLYVFAGGEVPAQFAFDGTTVLGWGGVVAGKDPLTIRSDQSPSLAGSTNLINFQGRNSGNVSSEFGKFGTVLEENAGAGGGKAKFSFQLNSGGGIEEKAIISSSGLGTFNGGVKAFNSNIACAGTNSVFVNTSRANAGSETNAFLWRPSGTLGNETSNNYFGFRSNHTTAVSYTCPVQAIHFLADGNAISNISPKNYAFYGAINISTGKENYNFFAAGTASNYFAGSTFIGVDSNLTNVAESPRLAFVGTSEPRIYSTIGSAQGTSIFSVTKEYSQANPNAAYFYKFQKGNGTSPATTVGAIYTDGATTTFQQSPSDYRIKTNIQPITSAANAVKLLNPVNYEFTDRNVGTVYQGFIAHELAEVCSKAVIGTKDAEEAIGTLLDYDGTELETAVAEPGDLTYTEEVETGGVATMVTRTKTWTPTGTQPIYQGVDQTKLIPLLTKALQEVLTKNEELEARIAALEGA